MIPSAGALYITFELAPGSDPIDPSNIDWSIVCADGVDYGNFATATTVGDQNAVNPLTPGATFDVVLTAAGAGGLLDECAPSANEDHTLAIQSGAGGFTYEVLNYGADVSAGAKVI